MGFKPVINSLNVQEILKNDIHLEKYKPQNLVWLFDPLWGWGPT